MNEIQQYFMNMIFRRIAREQMNQENLKDILDPEYEEGTPGHSFLMYMRNVDLFIAGIKHLAESVEKMNDEYVEKFDITIEKLLSLNTLIEHLTDNMTDEQIEDLINRLKENDE